MTKAAIDADERPGARIDEMVVVLAWRAPRPWSGLSVASVVRRFKRERGGCHAAGHSFGAAAAALDVATGSPFRDGKKV